MSKHDLKCSHCGTVVAVEVFEGAQAPLDAGAWIAAYDAHLKVCPALMVEKQQSLRSWPPVGKVTFSEGGGFLRGDPTGVLAEKQQNTRSWPPTGQAATILGGERALRDVHQWRAEFKGIPAPDFSFAPCTPEEEKAAHIGRNALLEDVVFEQEDGPEKRLADARGSVLLEAHKVINGERQDSYGSPEDSFALIADYWTTYLQSRVQKAGQGFAVGAKDVALMMVLFKLAREANQHKRDNLVDAAGYLGIAASLEEAK